MDEAGDLVQRVRLAGAELVDREDIESGPCDDQGCLYIGDIGENDAERDRITVYRVIEPEGGSATTAAAEPLHARYPDGARDAEALFIAAAGTMHVATKGRRGPITLYRWPFELRPKRTRDLRPGCPSVRWPRVNRAEVQRT